MNTSKSNLGKKTTRRLIDIESKNRLDSASIDVLSDTPGLLKQYLESSIANTFSELLFRMTHEIYTEKKATDLWFKIIAHRESLKKSLNRDTGMLVAALDYLANISGDLSNPKIIDDLRLEEAAEMATRDSLTGLYLRGVFEFFLEKMVLEHRRYGKAISLILLDIDDFKKVNDNYGHQAGDAVLSRIGKMIIKSIRNFDFPARYGGEEIVIIFPGTPIDKAAVLADRLRKYLNRSFLKIGPTVMVSIGVSCIHEPDIITAAELIREADKALYNAKRSGKNKVVKSTQSRVE
jgi:diguanylate cyclase (GGDEF)-like protein